MNLMLVMVKRLSVVVFQKLLVMIKGLCVEEIIVGLWKACQKRLQLGYLVV